MKTRIVVLGLVLAIGGCGGMALSRVASFENMKLQAKVVRGGFSDNITLLVNDTEVAKGTLQTVTPTTNLSGTYQGRKIDAQCEGEDKGGMHLSIACEIFVDGKSAANLVM